VRAVRSCCWYPGGSAATIVAALKYGGWRIVAEEMAERMSRIAWPRDVFEEQPLVVPVPLASQRERERGYNQSAELARSLGLRWKVEVMIDSLVRNRATETQTRLAPEERSRNVAGAFSLAPGVKRAARGKHIMLVDDVVTTASTLNECASVLFASGARIVSYCTFGRARAAADLT
jgi:ComF family protein